MRYFYQLIDIVPPRAGSVESDYLDMELGRVVDEWMPSPALVIDGLWNLLCYNEAAELVFGIQENERNLLVNFFANDDTRARYLNPRDTARLAVAQFRAGAAGRYDDPECVELIARLCACSEEFVALWRGHEIVEATLKTKELDHPEVGRLSFDTHSWKLDGLDIRLFLHVPRRTTDTKDKLNRLLRRSELVLVGD